MRKQKTVRCFVYGTLKRGGPLHESWLKSSTYVSDAVVSNHTLISLGPYPAMLYVNGDFAVSGELFDIPRLTFQQLAAMEEGVGYSTREVITDHGERVMAFVFRDIAQGEASWKPEVVELPDGRKRVSGKVVIDDIPF